MINHYFIWVYLVCAFYNNALGNDLKPRNPMLFMGTIQFPRSLTTIPDISIYCSGYKIKCIADNNTKRILFSITDDRAQTYFNILIIEGILFETEGATVKHLKIDPRKKYKFYTLQLKEVIPEESIDDHKKSSSPQFFWQVREEKLIFNDNKIPDTCIIICYNPAFIEEIRGGNCVELPTIIIDKNILAITGSEKRLHDSSAQMLLSSLDYNALHSQVKQEVRFDHSIKTVLAIST